MSVTEREGAEQIIREWVERHTLFRINEPLFVTRLRDVLGDPVSVAAVLMIIESTCPHCWAAEKGCQCWNDE